MSEEVWSRLRFSLPQEMPTAYEKLISHLTRVANNKEYFYLMFREANWMIPQLLQQAEGISKFFNQWFYAMAESLAESFSETNREDTIRRLKLFGYRVQQMHVVGFDKCEWWVIVGFGILVPAVPVDPKLSAYWKQRELHSKYDAVEVDPVEEIVGTDGRKTPESTDRDNPNITYWSVFLHLQEGGRECVADCESEQQARTVAVALRTAYRLPYPFH